MNIWHKRLVYLQIILLVAAAVLQWFFPELKTGIAICVMLFFFTEFSVLEFQRTENPQSVFYKKSCLFAVADLFSVMLFLGLFVLLVITLLTGRSFYNPHCNVWLFLYIALRKFYIVRNYSYEI